MAVYSIKDLERISGIRAHTIRIWEQRYEILNPMRTETNIRLYSESDLKAILNIASLNKRGYKISVLAVLSAQEIQQRVLDESDLANQEEAVVEQLLLATIDLDEHRFEEALQRQINRVGFDVVMEEIVYPFFERIGVLWQVGTLKPGQEHFTSNLIRQKLISAMDQLDMPSKSAPTVVAYLPEWELHELGLLYYAYQLKKAGFYVIYLGQTTPAEDIRDAINRKNPLIVLSAFVQPISEDRMVAYTTDLAKQYPNVHFWLSGMGVAELDVNEPNLLLLKHVNDLRSAVKRLM